MKIAFITPEAYPFIKTGGLADVAYALPKALAKHGHDARLILPRYYAIDKNAFNARMLPDPLGVPHGGGEKWAAMFESRHIPGVPSYFIEHDMYFGRDGMYGNAYGEYPDNAERFIFFSRAALQALKALHFMPDIIHCNDWQTALSVIFLKKIYANDPFFAGTASVMSVHNAGYQGVFGRENLFFTQLGDDIFTTGGLEFFGHLNFLKGGILFADAVTTVSGKYARELTTREFGYDLAGVFKDIEGRFYGIPNGVDYDKWDPARDMLISARYSPDNMAGKDLCKIQLQRTMGLDPEPSAPLLGSISRITYQKGMDVLAETMPYILSDTNCRFVILGQGDEAIIRRFENLKEMFPHRVALRWGFDERLSHLVESGSDIFVMPSRYEPCGLNQMYSLKYGTIPVVRATGGLDDTIEQWDATTGTGNGFKFDNLTRKELYQAIRHAIKVFTNTDAWAILRSNAMAFSRSWDEAAVDYEDVYRAALRNRQAE